MNEHILKTIRTIEYRGWVYDTLDRMGMFVSWHEMILGIEHEV